MNVFYEVGFLFPLLKSSFMNPVKAFHKWTVKWKNVSTYIFVKVSKGIKKPSQFKSDHI